MLQIDISRLLVHTKRVLGTQPTDVGVYVVDIPKASKELLNTVQQEVLAFSYWKDSLDKKGWPRKESGALLNYPELLEHWNTSVDQLPYLEHAKRLL